MKKEIKHTWFFRQPPQEVWAYLTQPELLEQWLTKTDFQPTVGHEFNFYDKTGKIIHCQVLEVNPITQLSYSWQYSSAKDNALFDSKVVWTLAPKEDGTELELVHNGFTALEDYIAHNNGWQNCVNKMEERLKTY